MQAVISELPLENLETSLVEKLEVHHGLSSLDNLKADREWTQANADLLGKLAESVEAGADVDSLLSEVNIEDKHWEWVRKGCALDSEEYEWFYAKSENHIEGICVIYHPQPSRIDSKEIFYVDYVAVAPWNRKNPFSVQKIKGIGSVLIRESLRFSVEELQYRPGFGLHSLPQAITYYEKIGMQNFGKDVNKQDLIYFEMSESQSERFL
jgi:hypothetical protein